MERAQMLFAIALASVGFLALVSPILVAVSLALFKGGGVRGRWLFVIVGPVLAYTVLWAVTLVFIVPATFVVVWLAPATKDLYNQLPYWYPVAEWFVKYDKLIASVACGALASWLALYVWPRWSALLSVLAAPRQVEGPQ
jgi:hypothetical protein